MPSPVIRTALMVRDLAVARRFYETVLGFTGVYFAGDITATTGWRLLGMPEGAALQACILKAPEIAGRESPDFGMIGLFEAAPGSLPEPTGPPRPDGVRRGEVVLVLYHADLDAASAAALAAGGSIVCAPITFEVRGGRNREMVLRDPDGICINLIERDPAVVWGRPQ
jgi:catechol 2,3-dioxygenase-like lactoylglutathione lyase family enzyme